MNIFWFSILFTLWYVFSLLISEKIGRKKKIGEEWSFFISMILSPVIGLIVTLSFPGPENIIPEENSTA